MQEMRRTVQNVLASRRHAAPRYPTIARRARESRERLRANTIFDRDNCPCQDAEASPALCDMTDRETTGTKAEPVHIAAASGNRDQTKPCDHAPSRGVADGHSAASEHDDQRKNSYLRDNNERHNIDSLLLSTHPYLR